MSDHVFSSIRDPCRRSQDSGLTHEREQLPSYPFFSLSHTALSSPAAIMPFLSKQAKYASRSVQHCARSSRLGAAGAPDDEPVESDDEMAEVEAEDDPKPNMLVMY